MTYFQTKQQPHYAPKRRFLQLQLVKVSVEMLYQAINKYLALGNHFTKFHTRMCVVAMVTHGRHGNALQGVKGVDDLTECWSVVG